MSKAPKAKKAALHYQPYQAFSINGEGEEPSMDLSMSDLPLHLDPVLSGLSSNMSRNLWDDWNENDANFGMKFDMFTDEVSSASTASSTASPNPSMHVANVNANGGFDQQQNASPNTMHSHAGSATPTHDKPRADVQRSLSEDIVHMLDDNNDSVFSKHLEVEQRRDTAMHNMMFNQAAGQNNIMAFQQQQQQQQQMPSHIQQFQHQQMHMQQQQFQQQQQQFQQAAGTAGSSWMNNFGGGNQTSATTTAPASGKPSNPPAHRRQSHPSNPSALDIAVAEGAASLIAKCPGSHTQATVATSSSGQTSTSSSAPQYSTANRGKFGLPVSSPNHAKEKPGVAGSQGSAASGDAAASADAATGNKGAGASDADTNGNNDTNMTDQSQQGNGLGAQGMMPNPFMMYQMMGPQGMNMMGMPMQMPMGMNGMNNMNGMQLPMQMQLQMQLQMQMQMAQLAQMNGMGGMNGMQMPMGLPGMPMGMNMQMPMNMNMQQQQQVNPQSGLSGDVEMTPVQTGFSVPATGAPMLKPARTLQPKGVRAGPGFVSIARKPEEPEVSSILKSLMDEEAKKKEKKLERNRDSARESRKKQQTYVETLENGIKRLQINRDLVRSYHWGVSGPGFGPLPCPNSPQMFDWKNRLEVVTGRTEAFSTIQNPANFQSLMRLNRQRRTLAMQHGDRERAVWKCFVFVGRQLAAMRTRVLQVQMLRTFSENPLAMELDAELKLSADQKLQLQCHAQQMFNQEVVELTKLFKIFFALRNEALRLNILSPTLERYFREACSFDQLQKLLQWSESHRTVIETDLFLDEV
uniref:BZIP domain-containing protein n=1 Tax=Phytophthora ramorum TaxID=164328 RepID=H3GH27_PHYRM